ncbi:MAG: diphthine--ammonia ligase [Candidatus Bathyarchaeia archaeon]
MATSWSGGKDSCLACYKAMCEGHKVLFLVNFISEEHGRVSFHGTPASLISEQADALGIQLVQRATSLRNYEEQFKRTVKELVSGGIDGMVFGDIYIQEHKDWVERVCGEVGVTPIEPLWGMRPEDVYRSFIDSGFEALIVSVKSSLLRKELVGRSVESTLLEYLKDSGIDVCGEKGEYHTFVTDGPIFHKKIRVLEFKVVEKDGNYFADIVRYRLEDK